MDLTENAQPLANTLYVQMKYIVIIMIFISLLNLLVSTKVIRKEGNERHQIIIQLSIIWLLPLLGAVLVYFVMKVDEEPRGPRKPPFGGGANKGTPV